MLLLLYVIELFFFFIGFFASGLFSYYGFQLSSLSIIFFFGLLVIHGIVLFSMYLLSYGIIRRTPWAKKFALFFIFWASLWVLWSIAIGIAILVNCIILGLYFLIFLYLSTPMMHKYFSSFYRYGKYILFKKIVHLKSGMTLPIYFFSSHQPHSGTPTPLPKGYTIGENPRSHMPYLKKEQNHSPSTNIIQSQINKRNQPVIYVVNNSEKGQNKWACRNEKGIHSYHALKKDAVTTARYLAYKTHARILVQNIHGKFSYGFTPRPMKKK